MKQRYHLDDLLINETRFYPILYTENQKKIRQAASTYGKNHDMAFSVESIAGGIEVKRIR